MSDTLTPEQVEEIWARRKQRALRWRRADGSIASGYPTVNLEEETEETLSAVPPGEEERGRKKREG